MAAVSEADEEDRPSRSSLSTLSAPGPWPVKRPVAKPHGPGPHGVARQARLDSRTSSLTSSLTDDELGDEAGRAADRASTASTADAAAEPAADLADAAAAALDDFFVDDAAVHATAAPAVPERDKCSIS
jgi:hypothetical protein